MSTKTINLIAQLAGVSRSTVSRVLNDNPSVNATTRANVQRVIKEQGYTPNRFARIVSADQPPTAGLIIPAIHDPFCSLLVSGAEDACRALGANLMLREGRQTADSEKRAIEELLGLGCDVLLIYAQHMTDDDLIRYIRRQPNILVLDRTLTDARDKCLSTDHIQGGRHAAEILIKRGASDIAAILGQHAISSQIQRWEGALAGFREAKLAPTSNKIIRTGNDIQDGRVAMRQLLTLGVSIDGLFCDNDALAIGAIQVLRENDIAVPDDIAVVGYGDLEFSAYSIPRLTTIKVPIYNIAYFAARELITSLTEHKAFPRDPVEAENYRQLIPMPMLRESA